MHHVRCMVASPEPYAVQGGGRQIRSALKPRATTHFPGMGANPFNKDLSSAAPIVALVLLIAAPIAAHESISWQGP